MSAFWICCRFPQLALETLAIAEAEARPLALISGAGIDRKRAVGGVASARVAPRSSQQIVAACNGAASREGIVPGMVLAAAYSRCPTLRCRDRQPDREAVRLKQLADIAYGFTSDVSLMPGDGRNQEHGLLLECAGSLRLFSGGAALLQALQQTWQQLEHHCDLGIAHTPLAAETLTRARVRLPLPFPLPFPLPEQTADQAAEQTVEQTLQERVCQALQHIELSHGPWPSKIIERFAASGLRTFGDVLALPRAALGRRFGESLLRDLDRLTGALPDPRPAIIPQPVFCASVQLLEDLRHRDGLLFPMRRLLKDLHAWLRLRQLTTDNIAWCFSDGRHEPVRMEVNLARPSFDVGRLFALSKLQLERTQLLPEINAVQLQSLNLVQVRFSESLSLLTYGQANVFANGAGQRYEPIHLLELFKARLGETGLRGIALADDHRPELGWRAVSLRNADALRNIKSKNIEIKKVGETTTSLDAGTATSVIPGLRPLWLLTEPRQLPRAALQLLRGPERIDLAWWALPESDHESELAPHGQQTAPLTATVARDYYIARDARGVLCWTYQTYGSDDWYVHGYFS